MKPLSDQVPAPQVTDIIFASFILAGLACRFRYDRFVDENRKPVPGTEVEYPCDTLLLSVGLIPENELSEAMGAEMSPSGLGPKVNERLETSIGGVFACGNVLHVHGLVDDVSKEAAAAGKYAALYVKNNGKGQGRPG